MIHWRPSSPGWMYISDILYFEIDSGWKWSNDLLGRDSSITRTLMGESWLKNQKWFFTEWSSRNELSAWSGDNFTVHWFCMRGNESSSHCCYRCCHNGGCVQYTMVHTWIFNFYCVNILRLKTSNEVLHVMYIDDVCWCITWVMTRWLVTTGQWCDHAPGPGARLTSGLHPPPPPSYLQPRLFRMWLCVRS